MLSVVLSLVFAAGDTPPNVLLLTVDTLRTDRLGAYGHDGGLTPTLDALAARGVVYANAMCEEPQTGPSMASMLTSRYPRVLGAVRNAVPIPGDVPLVAEIFANAGYETAAVVSNWNLKRKLSGLDRGFEHYDDAFDRKLLGLVKSERAADEVTDLALAWLRQRDTSRPFFFWVHYLDPHGPYIAHRGLGVADQRLDAGDAISQARARYDSEVAYTDLHIAELLAALPENTSILFTADHGESLHEHGYVGHTRRLYDNIMRIPLIVAAPSLPPGRISAPARGVDVGPTLLGMAGLSTAPGMLGLNLLESAPDASRVRVFETYDGDVPRGAGEAIRAELAARPPSYQGAILGGWKVIVTRDGQTELFNLAADPREEHNAAGEAPERADSLRDAINRWNTETPRNAGAAAALSSEDREALEALGYIE